MNLTVTFILLLCGLSASTSILYIKLVESQHRLAIQEVKMQLMQQQLDFQLELLNTLKQQSLANSSSIQAVHQGDALGNTFLFSCIGGVVILGIVFYLFSGNSRSDSFIGLAREMTSQHENLSRGITDQSVLNGRLMTEHFETLLESLGNQNATLVGVIESQNGVGQKIVAGNAEILDALYKLHLNENQLFGVLCSKIDIIDSILRQQSYFTKPGLTQAAVDLIKDYPI